MITMNLTNNSIVPTSDSPVNDSQGTNCGTNGEDMRKCTV